MAEQIIIEFISDTSQLQPAEDKLVALGKIDQASAAVFKQTNDQLKQRNAILDSVKSGSQQVTAEVSKEQQIYNKLAASVKLLSGASKEAVQSLLKMSAGEVAKGFEQAAVDVDDYVAALVAAGEAGDNTAKKTLTVRQELKELTNQLAALTAAGNTESEEFQALALQAGKLKNALADTQQTVGNLGQDVPVLKVFGAAVSGIGGAFSAATGAQALFGDENKDLQEVLVKVNGAMAVSTGLSQLLTVVNDEATLSTARAIATQTIANAKLAISNGLQSTSVVVKTAATAAQYALNLAITLFPIGAVVVALAAFITAIAIYTGNAKKAAIAQAELNAVLAETGHILDAGIEGINNANKKILADLDARGARESEIQAQQLRALKATNQDRLRAIDELNAKITANQDSTDKDIQAKVKEARDKVESLEKDSQGAIADIYEKGRQLQKQILVERLQDQIDATQARLSLAVKNSDQEFAIERQLAAAKSALDIQNAGEDNAKKKAIHAQLARDLADIDIAQAKVAQDQIAAALQSALIKAQNTSRAINDRTSQEEVDRQKAIILEQADFDVQQEGLKESQKQLIRDKANQQALELQRNFNRQATLDAIADQISANNAVLANIKLSEKDILDLKIENIILAASAEIEQNQGKIQKIKEIEAKRDVDIRTARLQSIEETLQRELALNQAQQAATVRLLEDQLSIQDRIANIGGIFGNKALAAQKLTLRQQIALIDQLTAYKLEADQKEIDANQREFDQRLINEDQFNLKNQQLIDKAAKDFEDGEKRKTDIAIREGERRKQANEALLNGVISGAFQAVGILQSLYRQDQEAAQARLDAQRQGIQDLADAGAITEKEAAARNKKLDVEQKKLQHDAAVRQKELAYFNAVINTAQAITAALTVPVVGPILAGIAAAIGLAQIAVISRQKIPQFGKGKKGNYEGYAEVGETGPEFVGRNGKLYYQEKPTITWLGASDKVFNPAETAAMIEARVPSNYYPGMATSQSSNFDFDYDRMGRAVGENIPQHGIGFDEHGLYEYQQTKHSFTKYLYKRRQWGSK